MLGKYHLSETEFPTSSIYPTRLPYQGALPHEIGKYYYIRLRSSTYQDVHNSTFWEVSALEDGTSSIRPNRNMHPAVFHTKTG